MLDYPQFLGNSHMMLIACVEMTAKERWSRVSELLRRIVASLATQKVDGK